jgi:hypothetical protein
MCVLYRKGHTFLKNSTRATSWTNGVKVGSVIGFDLRAQTGYSVESKIRTRFGRDRKVCGWNDWPGGTPGMVVYKSP